jgi:hypothetical protein
MGGGFVHVRDPLRGNYNILRVRRAQDRIPDAVLPPEFDFRYDDDREGPWTAGAEELYRSGGYEGLLYHFDRSVKQNDLEFIHRLPGLKYVEIRGRVKDDTAVFAIPTLEDVTLLTRCKRPMNLLKDSRIRRLGVEDRPGLESLANLGLLETLGLYLWRGTDLTFLGDAEKLELLKIEGKGQIISLQGLERCGHLRQLELLDMRVESLAPLRTLRELEWIWLIGDYRIEREPVLDLGDLSELSRLRAHT